MATEEGPSRTLVTVAAVTSVLYLALAVDFGVRLVASSVNASSKTSLLGMLLTTVVLYAIAVAVSYTERRRAGAPIPIVVASAFGIFMCLLLSGL